MIAPARKTALPDAETRFIEFLVENSTLSREASERMLAARSRSSQPFDLIATELGILTEDSLLKELSAWFDTPLLHADDVSVDYDLVERLGKDFLANHHALPVKSASKAPTLAIADPFDRSALQVAGFVLEKEVSSSLLARRLIDSELADIAVGHEEFATELPSEPRAALAEDDLDRLQDIASQVPVIRFVTDTIQNAVQSKATDVHLEPQKDRLVVRFRVDGVLQNASPAPRRMHAGIVTRIKVLARLNIAENRRPQDGRMRVTVKGDVIDLRVSILPSIFGETIVLRILDKSNIALDLEQLGFGDHAREQLSKFANTPNGIILATGPTGSGKTTTLYAMLHAIARPQIKIFTIEDPVEYEFEGATQLQVNPDIDFTFANALRSVLRQDPDVVLVGEIRDRETAEIAVRASLTGHLVLSTLHTNSAVDAIARLRDMGIEDFLLGATLRGIIGQRLLRTTCRTCAAAKAERLSCPTCSGTGYSGRTVCHEILPVTEFVTEAISLNASSEALKKTARSQGMVPMLDQARELVSKRITTPEEIRRVVDLDH